MKKEKNIKHHTQLCAVEQGDKTPCPFIIKKMKTKQIIVPVRENKMTHQKLITIPKDSGIEVGDYVQIIKIKKEVKKQNGTGQSIGSSDDGRNTSDGIPRDRFGNEFGFDNKFAPNNI